MGKVSLSINGRKYALGCDNGEEERLTRLGEKLNMRIIALADQFGQIGDLRLLVMAGITLLDEMEDGNADAIADVEERLVDAETQNVNLNKAVAIERMEATDSLVQAAEQIEKLAARLSGEGA